MGNMINKNINLLSFDIEEWYIEKEYLGARKEKYQEYDMYLNQILDILDDCNTKASFMCVGGLAKNFPHVIKKIVARGHEIGCHSNQHIWLNKLNAEQVRKDTKDAIAILEDITGKKIRSYRAPAFSIGENNKYALEILAENGIEIDSSIFPATRDFGGFPNFGSDTPTIISTNGYQLKEFPISTATIFGKKLAYSGGGYFRFFPLPYIRRQMGKSNYAISYFHIDDLMRPEYKGIIPKDKYEKYYREPGKLRNRIKRTLKSNIGKDGAFSKMRKLIQSTRFINFEEANRLIDWDKCEKIYL